VARRSAVRSARCCSSRDRAQHVAERLRPALAAGRIVISDRYTDSTLAYQGYGRRLPRHLLEAVAEVATGGLKPELTILLDVPVLLGLGRVGRRGTRDRLESEELEFHERVRDGYLALAAAEPDRYSVVDATRPPDIVSAEIVAEVRRRLHLGGA
jgi:dTMP kinase